MTELTKDNYLKINDDLRSLCKGKVICPDDLTFKGQLCKACPFYKGITQVFTQRYVVCMYPTRSQMTKIYYG